MAFSYLLMGRKINQLPWITEETQNPFQPGAKSFLSVVESDQDTMEYRTGFFHGIYEQLS